MMPTSSSSPRAGGGPTPGFTLLEVLLVLTIVGLATLVVAPNIGGLEARHFDVKARQAVALLNHARRTAVVTGMLSAATIYAAPEDAEALPAPARHSAGSWHGGDIELTYRDSTGQEQAIEDQLEFSFFPEGGSSGGTLLLAANGQRFVITIDPFTGRIQAASGDE